VPHFIRRQVLLMRDETELEAARRSRDSVLANVSHELKTPLSAQMASIQLLQDALGDEPPAEALELVESLERSTLRLTRLIDNLLESVRIETGRGSGRSVAVDLSAVIFEAEAMTYPLLKQRGQEISVDLPKGLGPVQGDPIQLAQVFVNLIANANKYAPAGTAIRIGGADDDHRVAIWVEDQGPGIPDAERGSVFEHYYRADPGAAEGMGLGLWIVETIVERHGGEVQVSSSPEGGARFTVSLPRMTRT
jgi:signal transduction histidine kinase